MITVLLSDIHDLRWSSSGFERSPSPKESASGTSDAERADHDEHRERDRLLAGGDAGLSDRRRRADRQHEVLRVHAGQQDRDPAALTGVS